MPYTYSGTMSDRYDDLPDPADGCNTRRPVKPTPRRECPKCGWRGREKKCRRCIGRETKTIVMR